MQFLELCSFNLTQFFNKVYNDPCLKALKDAGLNKEDISGVILGGGMTRMPKVILSASVPVLVLDKQRNVRRLVLMAIIGVVILVCCLALRILSNKKRVVGTLPKTSTDPNSNTMMPNVLEIPVVSTPNSTSDLTLSLLQSPNRSLSPVPLDLSLENEISLVNLLENSSNRNFDNFRVSPTSLIQEGTEKKIEIVACSDNLISNFLRSDFLRSDEPRSSTPLPIESVSGNSSSLNSNDSSLLPSSTQSSTRSSSSSLIEFVSENNESGVNFLLNSSNPNLDDSRLKKTPEVPRKKVSRKKVSREKVSRENFELITPPTPPIRRLLDINSEEVGKL